ncbi:MAG: hypothetical protein JKY19_05280 [Alcanivoracaceae bacterium]|nr:hypothetical protein [Alcanivoracaceae bacterium]
MPDNLRKLNQRTQTHKYWLELMAASNYVDERPDCYNNGPLVVLLETRVATLLGKEKALFFHKGVTAQLAALKVAAETKNNPKVILHPQSHIAGDEQNAYQALLGLQGIELGEHFQPFDYQNLCRITETVGSLVVELPLRHAGFKLTPWEELLKMQAWAKQKNTHFHMDGARLWESTHYYKKSLAQIADLFDSVYVSFYKGLGGLSGAVLAGSEEFINSCKVWRSRLGGDLYSAFPMLLTALDGLDNKLTLIPDWVARAHEIATELDALNKVTVDTPHTNGFVVFVEGDIKTLNTKLKILNKKFDMSLAYGFRTTAVPHIQTAELQVGPGAEEISTREIVNYFKELVS